MNDFSINIDHLCNQSDCNRLRIGCVLVKNNKIIGGGYNHFIYGCQSIVRDNHETMTIHAEQHAISETARIGDNTEGCTAIISHYPCVHCMKAMVVAGIVKIYYYHDYNNDELVNYISAQTGIQLEKIKIIF